jgi:hypothetical protein
MNARTHTSDTVMEPIRKTALVTGVVHRTGLVPRWMPTLGIIGAPLLLVTSTATLFGGWEQVLVMGMLLALPIATWELSVGVYMAVEGFKTREQASSAEDPFVPATPSDLAAV